MAAGERVRKTFNPSVVVAWLLSPPSEMPTRSHLEAMENAGVATA